MALLLTGCGRGAGQESEGLRVPESSLLRVFEHKSGQILYLGGDGNLYTCNQAGEDIIQITEDGNLDQTKDDFRGYTRFAWAPDSTKIAFIGRDHQTFVLSTANADGSNQVENFSGTEGDPIYLAWTPDGQYVSFLTNLWNPAGGVMKMYYLNREEASNVMSPEGGAAYHWVWEPGGGSRFLAHVERDGQSQILMISTRPEHEAVIQIHPGIFSTPAWSPDGQQLLLAIADPVQEQNTLVITNLQGVVQRKIGPAGNSTAFSWSPDGTQIAYIASDRKLGNPLGPLTVQNMAPPNTETSDRVIVDDPYIFAFFWSPNSEKLAYFTLDVAPGDVYSPDSGGVSSLVTLYVLDIKTGERKNLLSFYPTYPFMDVLQHFDQYQYSASFWSPDSENMIISALDNGGQTPVLVVVPMTGNVEPRQIAQGWLGFWSTK